VSCKQAIQREKSGIDFRKRKYFGLSEHTVKKYLFHIFDKLGISSRVELVLYAVSHGGARQAEWVAGGG
jgi:Bacterial regulatory proteins, luxR family